MNRKLVFLIIIILLIVTSVFSVLFFASSVSKTDQNEERIASAQKASGFGVEKEIVYLYFANKNNLFLSTEERILTKQENPVKFGTEIINALISGPLGNLKRTIPETAELNSIYIIQNGTAYVDLSINAKTDHPGGIQSEIITIYSIVNSLVVNIPLIKNVKFLIGNNEEDTLAGHVDLRFPFKANMIIVR